MINIMKSHGKSSLMILIHARKAAGTTMDKWMALFIDTKLPLYFQTNHNLSEWKCELIKIEAFTSVHKQSKNFITECMNKYPFAIYVISLRHPIDRILSQYEFEWRWRCIRCGILRDHI